jgi:hypothetical protein
LNDELEKNHPHRLKSHHPSSHHPSSRVGSGQQTRRLENPNPASDQKSAVYVTPFGRHLKSYPVVEDPEVDFTIPWLYISFSLNLEKGGNNPYP